MPPDLGDGEMSDDSGVGAVTKPPPSKRGRKISSYVDDNSEGDTNDSDDYLAKSEVRLTGTSQNAGAAPSAKKASKRTNGLEKEDIIDDDEEEDDEDIEEDEYEVKEIIGHMVDEAGKPRFQVFWKGYEDPSDHTWEPEENLTGNASETLSEYISKIGGYEKLLEKPAKGKKRGRPSANTPPAQATAKRAKKSTEHPRARDMPSALESVFKPPAGSWEDDVTDVDMFQGENGELRVYLTWKTGDKTQHPAKQAYVRCPQKILRFYESRINFKPTL